MDEPTCVFCGKHVKNEENCVTLREKGSKSINVTSKQCGDSIRTVVGQVVHVDCRRDYVNKKRLELSKRESERVEHGGASKKRVLRSDEQFSFDVHCVFCGNAAMWKRSRKESAGALVPVRTIHAFRVSVLKACTVRNDHWGQTVAARLQYAEDCVAVEASYHQVCSTNFRTGRNMPLAFRGDLVVDSQRASGRPENSEQAQAFRKTIDTLQEDQDQMTVVDLTRIMLEHLQAQGSNSMAYGPQYMKVKLIEQFVDDIIIADDNGKSDVVTLRTAAKNILRTFFETPKSNDPEHEKQRLIAAAAELISSDIKSMPASRVTYPTSDDIASLQSNIDYLPTSLRNLLCHVIPIKNNELVVAAIGQAVLQSARPRTLLAPLQIGLAVQLHHMFASRFLITSLNQLGFCSSYAEVQKMELNAAATVPEPPLAYDQEDGRCLQYVADNVDHNIATLDGHGTFHGMGIISIVTPSPAKRATVIHRKTVDIKDIREAGSIKILHPSGHNGLTSLMYNDLRQHDVQDPTSRLTMLWKLSWALTPKRPSWLGVMQHGCDGCFPGKSTVTFLPMIDMAATNMSCIFSTLSFAAEQAMRQGMTPIITFDQPLWWKAQSIVHSDNADDATKSIVLRLGMFHTQMSFLGSIGHIMAGSGLQDLLELIYAPNTVGHMLSGKAYARAIRGHMLVDAALNALLVSETFGVPHTFHPPDETIADDDIDRHETTTDPDLREAAQLFHNSIDDSNAGRDVWSGMSDDLLQRIQARVDSQKVSLSARSRTGKLWLLYMEMVDVLRSSIAAERTGNFLLHLQCVAKMLPYFAASGHNLYAKSCRLYLQQMLEMQESNAAIYRSFTSGHHICRRSDRYWAGLSTDLVIEQVLMKSLKSRGGLTRGRGMTESQRLVWLQAMPACAEVNMAMQELTGVDHTTSEQHKDVGKVRQDRDQRDTATIVTALQNRSPFDCGAALKNIINGQVAHSNVNVDDAQSIGDGIMRRMIGQRPSEVKFTRKSQAVTMASRVALKVDDELVVVDPQLLFQRLTTVATNLESKQDVFQYELTTVPAALFDSLGYQRQANKASLGDYLWTLCDHSAIVPCGETVHHVLDGGSLLHRVTWPQDVTYCDIINEYVTYVKRRYCKATVVFDGYGNGPSTKDVTHNRRKGGRVAPDIDFSGSMRVCYKMEQFLSNGTNKQRLITMLIRALNAAGYGSIQAADDADVLIVQTTIRVADTSVTVLIGEDTDLLVLLLQHTPASCHAVYLVPGRSNASNKETKIWHIQRCQEDIGPRLCHNMLFAHAIGGCDTTARLYGISKNVPLKRLSDDDFMENARNFYKEGVPVETIATAGERLLVSIYGGNRTETLDHLRYTRFAKKVSTSKTAVLASSLPPTSSSAKYHSFRAYYQIRQWMDIGNDTQATVTIDPLKWGWKLQNGQLVAITTDMPAAPDGLLRVVRCNCKTDCSTVRCSCRKHGLQCSACCGDCRGTSCTNGVDVGDADSSTEDDVQPG